MTIANDPLASAPKLTGNRFELLPVSPQYHRAIFELSLSNSIAFRWRFRGQVPTFEQFEQALYSRVLVQFVVVPRRDKRRLAGLVVAYDANLQDGHAYLGAISDPRFGVGTLEGVVLCLTYLFTMWPLRKIYLDAPEYNVPQFASAIERGIVVEEGRLAKHRFYNGKYWDQCLFAIYREKYLELISE